jgi:hypothetical protein
MGKWWKPVTKTKLAKHSSPNLYQEKRGYKKKKERERAREKKYNIFVFSFCAASFSFLFPQLLRLSFSWDGSSSSSEKRCARVMRSQPHGGSCLVAQIVPEISLHLSRKISGTAHVMNAISPWPPQIRIPHPVVTVHMTSTSYLFHFAAHFARE